VLGLAGPFEHVDPTAPVEDLAEILYAACDLPDGRTDLRKYGEATALLARARQLLDRAAGLSLTPDRSKAGG